MSSQLRGRARTRIVGVLAIAALSATGLAACSSSSGASGSSGSNSADIKAATALINKSTGKPTTITQTAPLKAAPGKGSIVFISNGEPGTVVIGHGTEAAAKAAGWGYSTITYDASSPASLQAAFLNALTKHPTFVTEAGTPQSQFGASVIAQYKAAGVKIIPTSTDPVTKNDVIPVSEANIPNGYAINKKMGEVLAAWFVKDSGGKGKALIPNVTAFPTLQGTVDGFKEETKKLCPDCTVQTITVSLSDVAAGTVVNTAVSAVRRLGANYLLFDNGEFGTGAQAALQAAGLNDVVVGGISPQPAQISAMASGTKGGWVLQGFQYVGWATLDLAFRYEEKSDLTTADATQPVQLVTPDNAKKVSTNVDIPIPASGLDQFKKLWKVK